MQLLALLPLILILVVLILHRSTARATTKTGARQVWAQASDTRYPRYPTRRPFSRKHSIK